MKIKLHSLLAFLFAANFLIPVVSAGTSSDELLQKMDESTDPDTQTLAAPLLFSNDGKLHDFPDMKTLLNNRVTVGYEGDIAYQKIAGQSFRLQYQDLKQDASFFYLFEDMLDLRNRWFRLRYSGLAVPSRLAIHFDPDEARGDSEFFVYLNDSTYPETVFFKLPDKLPFSAIHSIRFVMDPENMATKFADFLILDLELMPEGEDPLEELPESDLARFDWFTNPFSADNQAPAHTHKTF